MPSDRYRRLKPATVDNEVYDDMLLERGIDITKGQSVRMYRTPPRMAPIKNVNSLKLVAHTWSTGDRYWKLAAEHYGDATYWWVIARFNYRPTESHVKLGDTIIIPKPLERVISRYGT